MSYFSHRQFGVLGAIKAASSTFLSQAEASRQVSPPTNFVGLACWVCYFWILDFSWMLILFLVLLIAGSPSLAAHCSGLLCPRWLPCRNPWALPSWPRWRPAASSSFCAPREEQLCPSCRIAGSTSPTSRSPTSSTTPSLWPRRYSSQPFSLHLIYLEPE